MVVHVVGRLGSGKTLWAVTKIIDTLIYTDKVVYTNIRLVDFWDYVLAQYVSKGLFSFVKFFLSPMPTLRLFRLFLAKSYSSRYIYSSTLDTAVELCFSLGSAQESSRLFIWDEIHLDLNARQWKDTSMRLVQFFSMSRKLGFDIIIVSQLRGAVDRQMRELADISYELKNLRHFAPFGLRLFPNLGLLVKRWANKGMETEGKTVFVGAGIVRFGGVYVKFYDTKQLLTDKNLPSPHLWFTSLKDPCLSCSFFTFYSQYKNFIDMYYPPDLNYIKPFSRRLINKEVGGITFKSYLSPDENKSN
ncbi:MAG: zonular occludens toxin domain-containing protein [Nitrospiraceae bacterium]|nr:zonular occludens toxin domain-containing protein [Nitrospiraceae bacterium]